MSSTQRTVLITGCSDGGLGAALAVAFHEAGLHVYATARKTSKMKGLNALGIETLQLDVLDDSSIAACVEKISSLDILVNNAGAGYNAAISDMSILEAKKLFDLNVWSYLAVTKAFLPLLLQSKGMVVNQTSVAGSVCLPFQSAYSASKAAMAMFSDSFRLEMEPFDVTVVDLKTGNVQSNFFNNVKEAKTVSLPQDSIYLPAKEAVEKALRGDGFENEGVPADQWAKSVVSDLLKKRPPPNIWRGANAGLVRLGTVMPFGTFDSTIKKKVGMDLVEKIIKK